MKGKEVILGLLNTKCGLTGYQINDILQIHLRHFYDGGFGMIYPTLKNLEKDGLVSKKRINQDDKPNKNIFITDSGKIEFKKSVNEKTEPEILKSDFLMKIYFGDSLLPGKQIDFLKEELNRKKSDLNDLLSNMSDWDSNGITDHQNFTVTYGMAYYKAVIEVIQLQLDSYNKRK